MPAFGPPLQIAILHFSLRTMFRSAQHRMILAFYWGIAFAIAIIFVKSPAGQQLAEVPGGETWLETSVPLLVSSLVMMAFAVVAGRLAFAMPRDLRSNWIFRVVGSRNAVQYVSARRRALAIVSVVPVCAIWAVVLFWRWPWQAALGHVVALGCLGAIFVEVALIGALKIPCTCSYLPGKSHVNLVVCAAALVLLPLVVKAASVERVALQDPFSYATMLAALCVVWLGVRRGIAWTNGTGTQPTFDDEPVGAPVTLELSDTR
jgi:hypothetical protein